jgi:CubicO group peptidase (beta-lactamase class C family)
MLRSVNARNIPAFMWWAVLLALVVPLTKTATKNGKTQPNDKPVTSSYDFGPVRAFIFQKMQSEQLPSVAVAVAKHGKIIWEEGFGWANREKMIPATANTMFSLASISKPITATGLMKLVEQGKIELDKPINDYLGFAKLTGLAGDPSGATVRRVMSHTSGLPLHYHFYYENSGEAKPPMDQTIARYGILVNPPGQVFQYSNLGYGLIDYVIERISRRTYADYMRREVFLPLGMTHTSVGIDPSLEEYAATRYDSEQQPIPFYDTDHPGASAIYCSAHDLVRFGMYHLKDHLADQEQILKDDTITTMQEPAILPTMAVGVYGLGWGVDRDKDRILKISHSGGMPGASTILNIFPTEDVAVVALTNTNNEVVLEIADRIAAAVIPKYSETLEAKSKKDEKSESFIPPAQLIGQWSGTIKTWEGTIPIWLTFKVDGDIHIKIGDELETVLNEVRFRDEHLTGRFAGTIPTKDASRHSHLVLLNVRLREEKLSGQVSAKTWEEPNYFALTSYVEVKKNPSVTSDTK